jgi:hypothetical protein
MFLTSTVQHSNFSLTEASLDLLETVLDFQESIAESKFEIIALEHEALMKKEQGYLSEAEFLEAEEEVKEKGTGFFDKVIAFLKNIIAKVGAFFTGLMNKIKAKFASKQEMQAPTTLGEKVGKIIAATKAYVEDVVKNPDGHLAELSISAILGASVAWTAYKKEPGQSFLSAYVQPLIELGQMVKSKLAGLESALNAAKSKGDAAEATRVQKIIGKLAGLTTKIGGFVSWAISAGKAAPGKAMDAAVAAKDKVVDAVKGGKSEDKAEDKKE